MVTIFDFSALALDDQAHYVGEKGKYLLSRNVANYRVNLYSVNNFYTEIWYSSANDDLFAITSFKTSDLLHPYLAEVALSRLFL